MPKKTLFLLFFIIFCNQSFASEATMQLDTGYWLRYIYKASGLTFPAKLGKKWITITDCVKGVNVNFSYCRQSSCQKGPLADMYQDRLPETYVSCGWRDRDYNRFGAGFQRRHDFRIPGYSKNKSYLIKVKQAYSIKTPDMIPEGWPNTKTSLRLINRDHRHSLDNAHSMHHFRDYGNDSHRYNELTLELTIPRRAKKFHNHLRLDFLGVNVQDVRFFDLTIEIVEIQ